MAHEVEERSPLRRAMRNEEVGKMAAALLSDLGSGVTGQTVYVDVGYSIVGAVTPSAAPARTSDRPVSSDQGDMTRSRLRWRLLRCPNSSDNYAYLVIDDATNECGVVDCAEADKVLAAVSGTG